MKHITTAFLFAIATAMVSMTPSFAYALTVQDNGSTAGTISAPATQDNGTTAAAPAPSPATQDNGTTAGTISTPITQNNGTTAGSITTPATQDNGSTAGKITPPVTQDNGNTAGTVTPPPSNNGGSTGVTTSGGGSGSFSSGGSGFSGRGPSLPVNNLGNCDYITTNLKMGDNNSVVEVTKLQNFLKTNEGMDLAITGIFDQVTFDAVSIFQAKYKQDILTPWGITNPTGHVYHTTRQKINALYCKQLTALTGAQTAEISAYKNAVHNGTTISGTIGKTSTTTPSQTIANSTSTSDQVAGAGKTSVISKVWSFVKRIFGR